MKVRIRIVFVMMLASIVLTGCETIYVAEPTQPYINPPVVVGYPSAPPPVIQAPAPIQTPPLPPSVPAKPPVIQAPPPPTPPAAVVPAVKEPTVIPANQPITTGDMPVMYTAPEKPPGSMSELPDPS